MKFPTEWTFIKNVPNDQPNLQLGGPTLYECSKPPHVTARHCDTAARFPSSSAERSREATKARPAWPVVAWRLEQETGGFKVLQAGLNHSKPMKNGVLHGFTIVTSSKVVV
jgi:hypothetical protein